MELPGDQNVSIDTYCAGYTFGTARISGVLRHPGRFAPTKRHAERILPQRWMDGAVRLHPGPGPRTHQAPGSCKAVYPVFEGHPDLAVLPGESRGDGLKNDFTEFDAPCPYGIETERKIFGPGPQVLLQKMKVDPPRALRLSGQCHRAKMG